MKVSRGNNMINVGIIGSGFIVRPFIESIKAVKGYKCRAICARNIEKLKALKEEYNMDYYSTDVEELFNDPKIDVIYLAVPNNIHYSLCKRALLANKHVIVEKPFTPTYIQAKQLIDLAYKKNLIVFDAVTLIHNPNYLKIQELIKDIGEIKMVTCNFSQYSSRYDSFKKGIILPVFDYKQAGGALMDLGIYNINLIVGLFNEPKKVNYYPNMKRKIDTSGLLVMDYGKFKVSSIAAKDCKAPSGFCIEGDLAHIKSDYPCNILRDIYYVDNKGNSKHYDLKHNQLNHYHEFKEFKRLYKEKDLKKAREYNKLTLKTIRVLEKAIKSGKIIFN